MTKEQSNTANTILFGVFCAAMLGVYWWSCERGQRRLDRLNDSLIEDAKSARERYEPLLRPVPEPRPRRRTKPEPEASADGQV